MLHVVFSKVVCDISCFCNLFAVSLSCDVFAVAISSVFVCDVITDIAFMHKNFNCVSYWCNECVNICYSGKPRGLRTARKHVNHRREQRWADNDYKKAHLGTRWKANPFGGASHAKGIVLEKV